MCFVCRGVVIARLLYCEYLCMYVYLHISYENTYVYTYVDVYIYVIYMHAYVFIYWLSVALRGFRSCDFVIAVVWVFVYVCVRTCIIFVCTYVYAHIICIHLCICVYIFARRWCFVGWEVVILQLPFCGVYIRMCTHICIVYIYMYVRVNEYHIYACTY